MDDEKATRDVLLHHFPWKSFGIHEVREADDGVNALELSGSYFPDLVVSDVRMPRMTGIELAEKLLELNKSCKFIFLSGYSDKEYLKSAIRLKAVNYVEKPVDMDELSEAVRTALSEYEKEKASKNMIPVFSQKLCLGLINRKSDFSSIRDTLAGLGFDFPSEGLYLAMVLFLITPHPETSMEKNEIRSDLLSMTDALFKPFPGRILVSPKGDDYIVILASLKSREELPALYGLLDAFPAEFEKKELHTENSYFIGIGKTVSGLNQIYDSYHTAVIALNRCFFTGLNTLCRYSEAAGPSFVPDENSLAALVSHIKLQNINEAVIGIKRLFNTIRLHDGSLADSIKEIFIQLIFSLTRIAEDRNDPLLLNECKVCASHISGAHTLMQIEQIILGLAEAFCTNPKNNTDGDIITKINDFILEQYRDEHLSLNVIAEKFYLSLNYLCHLYKKETGKTIKQFITDVRIEKAKELLKAGRVKYYHVARDVGYTDGKYFSKVFLKTVGMGPREYRERHANDPSVE